MAVPLIHPLFLPLRFFFNRSPGSSCLDDSPASNSLPSIPGYEGGLVGALVDADEQCRLQYGLTYARCPSMRVRERGSFPRWPQLSCTFE